MHSKPAFALNMSAGTGAVSYTFGPWQTEDMGIHRVGGLATNLPNGDIVLSGGAQVCCRNTASCALCTSGNYNLL